MQNLLGHRDAFPRRYSVCLPYVAGRILMARNHVVVTCSFFDFGTVHFSTGLFSLEVEVLDRLTMALDSPMVSHYRRLAGSRIGYIGWGYFLFASAFLVLEREDQLFRGGRGLALSTAVPRTQDILGSTARACSVHDLLTASLVTASRPHGLDLL